MHFLYFSNLTEHRTYDQAEAHAYTKLANSELKDPVLRPLSLFDLRDTLQVREYETACRDFISSKPKSANFALNNVWSSHSFL